MLDSTDPFGAEPVARPAGAQLLPDPAAIRALGAGFCARNGIVPMRPAGALRPILCEDVARFHVVADHIRATLGTVVPYTSTEASVPDLLMSFAGDPLALDAEQRSPMDQSCRALSPRLARFAITSALLALAVFSAPKAAFLVANLAAVVCLLIHSAVHAVALCGGNRRGPEPQALPDAQLPIISILIPLYHEKDIAAMLLDRIARLDYPRDRLDLCMIVEHSDNVTAAALSRTELPAWGRVISVAPGTIQTKPRAMNMALEFCKGSIVGIYDAEDAPDPMQLRMVAARFAASGPEVAALQGRLNFYNTRASWLTRCFAIDYAAWFWVTLPTVRRLGWPVLLGGTTVFIRRAVLEEVGGWDAHNVTEDADLGIRLARAGYVTDLIDSVTYEEATARPKAWIRQRSRWQKGYAVTWVAHMRYPWSLLRDLGPWRFAGVQVLLLVSLVSAALAPFLWPVWLLAINAHHPVAQMVHPLAFTAISLVLGATFAINLAVLVLGLKRQGRLDLWPWLPVMQIYYPMATLSLVKALFEFMFFPFFWDKTAHGVTLPDGTVTDPPPAPHPA